MTSYVAANEREHIAYPFVFDRFQYAGFGDPYVVEPHKQLRIREGSCEQNAATNPVGTFTYPGGIGNIPFTVSNSSSVCNDNVSFDNCSEVGVVMDVTVPPDYAGSSGPYFYNMSYYWDYPSGEDPGDDLFDLYDDYSHELCDCRLYDPVEDDTCNSHSHYQDIYCNSSMEDRIPSHYFPLQPFDAGFCGASYGSVYCSTGWSTSEPCGVSIRAHGGKNWMAMLTNESFDSRAGRVTTYVDPSTSPICSYPLGEKWGILLNANHYDEINDNWAALLIYFDVANDLADFRYLDTGDPNSLDNVHGLRMDDQGAQISSSMCYDEPGKNGSFNLTPSAHWLGTHVYDVEWYLPENKGDDCILWVNGQQTCVGQCLQYVGNPSYHQAQNGPMGYLAKGAWWKNHGCSTTCYCRTWGGCDTGDNPTRYTGTHAVFTDLLLYPEDSPFLDDPPSAMVGVNLSIELVMPEGGFVAEEGPYYPFDMLPDYYDLVLTGEGYPFGVCDLDEGSADDWLAVTPGLVVRE